MKTDIKTNHTQKILRDKMPYRGEKDGWCTNEEAREYEI